MICELEFFISVEDRGRPIQIQQNHRVLPYQNGEITVVRHCLNFDYRNIRDNLRHSIFTLSGFTPGLGQRVTVKGVRVNGETYHNFYPFCSFQMLENLYVDNVCLKPQWELCFNGEFCFDIQGHEQQFQYFPYYYSDRADDWVANTVLFDCDNPRGCLHGSGNVDPRLRSELIRETPHSTPVYANRPYPESLRVGESIDYLCLGDSVTQGRSILESQRWPTLLRDHTHSHSVNLGLIAGGADAILQNLECSLREFRVNRVVILLPNLERYLARWVWDGLHFRLPIVRTPQDHSGNYYQDNFWGNIDQVRRAVGEYRRVILPEWGPQNSRLRDHSRASIDRILELTRSQSIPTRLSSWDPETYQYLETVAHSEELLTRFEQIDEGVGAGPYESFPGAESHRRWYEQNSAQIQS